MSHVYAVAEVLLIKLSRIRVKVTSSVSTQNKKGVLKGSKQVIKQRSGYYSKVAQKSNTSVNIYRNYNINKHKHMGYSNLAYYLKYQVGIKNIILNSHERTTWCSLSCY